MIGAGLWKTEEGFAAMVLYLAAILFNESGRPSPAIIPVLVAQRAVKSQISDLMLVCIRRSAVNLGLSLLLCSRLVAIPRLAGFLRQDLPFFAAG